MSNRSNTADARARRHERGSRSRAWALLILGMTLAGLPGAARADAIILKDGETINGSIIYATRNTVIIRRAVGGMRQLPIHEIAEVRLDLGEGQQIVGQLVGWDDGVHEVRSGGEALRVSAGRILSRERRDQVASQPPTQTPRSPARQPGGARGVTPEGATATAPAPRTEAERARAPAPEVAVSDRAAATEGFAPPAPTPAGPTRAAAAPGALAPGAGPVAQQGGTDGPAAQDSAAAARPAALAHSRASTNGDAARIAAAEASASDAPSRPDAASRDQRGAPPAATSEGETAKTAAGAGEAPSRPEAASNARRGAPSAATTEGETAKTAAVEADAGDPPSRPAAASGDQPVAVRGTVDPAQTGVDGIVFRIELSRPAEQPVVLIYGTLDGTAKAGKDYEAQQGVVTLTPGSTSAAVRVPLLEHPHPRDAGFEFFLMADPKVANVIDQRIAATMPAAD